MSRIRSWAISRRGTSTRTSCARAPPDRSSPRCARSHPATSSRQSSRSGRRAAPSAASWAWWSSARTSRIGSRHACEIKQLKLLKTPIKGIYILLFLLMTLIVVFSFTWIGLYLARGITGPIEQLAEGTREVAAGNLAYKVPTRGDDEIGVLVEAFNRMTDDLAKSKRQLEEAYLDLSDKHTELEDRRVYIETVLAAITTGAVSLDPLGRLTTINRAAARMLGVNEATAVGRFLEEVFAGPD